MKYLYPSHYREEYLKLNQFNSELFCFQEVCVQTIFSTTTTLIFSQTSTFIQLVTQRVVWSQETLEKLGKCIFGGGDKCSKV
jgi:hypothetical protein